MTPRAPSRIPVSRGSSATRTASPPPESAQVRVRPGSPAELLAIVPHLLGFVPQASLVVMGTEPPRGRVKVTLRYDLPDPPGAGVAADIAAHAVGIVGSQQLEAMTAVGYGTETLVDPVAYALRDAAGRGRDHAARRPPGRGWPLLVLRVRRRGLLPGGRHALRSRRQPRRGHHGRRGNARARRPGRGGGAGRAAGRGRRRIHAPGHPPGRAARRPVARQGPQVRPPGRRAADDRRRGAERGGCDDRHLPRRRQVRHRLPARVDHGGTARPAGQGRRLGPDGPGAPGRAPAAVDRRDPAGAARVRGRSRVPAGVRGLAGRRRSAGERGARPGARRRHAVLDGPAAPAGDHGRGTAVAGPAADDPGGGGRQLRRRRG